MRPKKRRIRFTDEEKDMINSVMEFVNAGIFPWEGDPDEDRRTAIFERTLAKVREW
jgi:hypothetical protein